jgi:hypothetical protein
MRKIVVGIITLLMLITTAPAGANVQHAHYHLATTVDGVTTGQKMTLKQGGTGNIAGHPVTYTYTMSGSVTTITIDEPIGADVYEYVGQITSKGICLKTAQCVFTFDGSPAGSFYAILKSIT